MAKTYLDQIVEYPAKVIQKISEDKQVVSLILNKDFNEITEDDFDETLDSHIYSYQYVDSTVTTVGAFVWVEIAIPNVNNKHIKDAEVYVTVACHKQYMKLDHSTYKSMMGNRRDNIVRYIDKLINNSPIFGIGNLTLKSVRTLNPYNQFIFKELTYTVPEFNVVDCIDEV